MNKRGQGLPLNVIVIAIIVVVALVVIVAFFLGGFGKLGQKAGQTTGEGLIGTSQALATASCENLCNFAQDVDSSKVKATEFCLETKTIEKTDGTAEEKRCDELVTCKNTATGKDIQCK